MSMPSRHLLETPAIVAPPVVTNTAAVDLWTFAHVGLGVVTSLLDLRWTSSLAVASTWEIIERPLIRILFPQDTPESDRNMIADVVAWMAGWGIIQLGKAET